MLIKKCFPDPALRSQALLQALPHPQGAVLARAPGRVNLIGEHTDYNEGYVLPMALDLELWVAAAPRKDRQVGVRSLDLDEAFEFPLDGLRLEPYHGWANYVKAVLWALQQQGRRFDGVDLVLQGDLPRGGGLSSSAALELALARAMSGLNGWDWDPVAMARLGQRAENQFMGVHCGIMDQMAVAVGQPGCALFLDCRDLSHRSVPVAFTDARFVVVHSGVTRGLEGSEYNLRRADCEAAVAALAPVLPGLRSLRDLKPEDLQRHSGRLSAQVLQRARHVVSEIARVPLACAALEQGSAASFGALMQASHRSLAQDYEVSSPPLDALVEIGLSLPGGLGSRLTGAGFGGCTVHLVEEAHLEAFQEALPRLYLERSGLQATVIPWQPSAPASLVGPLWP